MAHLVRAFTTVYISRVAAAGMCSGDARNGEFEEMDKKTGMALLAARFGIGVIFLASGLGKLMGWSDTVAYAGSRGVPEILLVGATALEILGAVSLLAGWKTRWGVAALVAFLVPVTLVFHDFWAYQGAEVQLQSIQFLKNVGIGGGLLAVLGAGPGALSLDARRSRRQERGLADVRAGA
jgi:putative oxidoreductase